MYIQVRFLAAILMLSTLIPPTKTSCLLVTNETGYLTRYFRANTFNMADVYCCILYCELVSIATMFRTVKRVYCKLLFVWSEQGMSLLYRPVICAELKNKNKTVK